MVKQYLAIFLIDVAFFFFNWVGFHFDFELSSW